MNQVAALGVLSLIALAMLGCGKKAADKPVGTTFGPYQFEAGIPSDLIKAISSDLEQLDKIQIKATPELKQVLGIEDVSNKSLSNWLSERIHYFSFTDKENQPREIWELTTNKFQYPDTALPILEEPENTDPLPPGKKLLPLMANFSASVYVNGKKERKIYGMPIEGWGMQPIDSPRAGIIMLYRISGYEDPWMSQLAVRPLAQALYTLHVLFHEAKHSDGEGVSLTYPHGNCSSHHKDLHGRIACDKIGNGPYSVGAHFLQAATEACSQCTAAEKDDLKNVYLNDFSRVNPATKNIFWKDGPERLVEKKGT